MAEEPVEAPAEEAAEVEEALEVEEEVSVEAEAPAVAEDVAAPAEPAAVEEAVEEVVDEVYDAPMEAEVVEEVTKDDRLWALLSWLLWPLAIVALVMGDKKTRPFIKYNAVNSLAFAVVWYVLGALTVGCVGVLGLIYAIYLAIKAYQGEWVKVPLLSDFVKNQGWA